ncbi:MAG: M3 family oligoendopeptidase, partial [Candidatus Binatia bacterium]
METDGIRWDLGELYAAPDDPAIERDLDDAAASARAFEATWRGKIVGADATSLLAAVRQYERIHEVGGRPYFYSSLLTAADTQDETAQRLEQRAREHWTEIRNLLLFFPLEIQAIPEERVREVAGDATLAPYHYFLVQSRRFAPHTLSEPEEKILNQKALTSRAAFVQLFDELSGSLRFEIEIEGERKLLTDAETMALLRSPRRDMR